MPRIVFPEIHESLDELEAIASAQSRKRLYQRAQALVWIKSGVASSRRHIAQLLGVHYNTVGIWLQTYEQQGLEELLSDGKTGPESQRILPDPVFVALGERLNTPEGFDSFVHAQQWLKDIHEIEVNYWSLWSLIKREFGGKLKTPRPSHPKKKLKRSLLSLATSAS